MKERADEIESKVFGGPASWARLGMWIRQKSIDGQAVIRAGGRSQGGSVFNGIEIFNFDDEGNFVERLEAVSGELRDGYWVLHDVVVVTPGFEALPSLHLPAGDEPRPQGGRAGVCRAGNGIVLAAAWTRRTDRARGIGPDSLPA